MAIVLLSPSVSQHSTTSSSQLSSVAYNSSSFSIVVSDTHHDQMPVSHTKHLLPVLTDAQLDVILHSSNTPV